MDDDFAFEFAASGASGDLSDELEGTLTGAEIRNMQAEVGVENSNQSDIGKMQTFGNHLGADEDIDLLRFEFLEDVFESVFTAHRIGIDTCETSFGENFL